MIPGLVQLGDDVRDPVTDARDFREPAFCDNVLQWFGERQEIFSAARV